MVLTNWVLPILMGIVAAIALISILYNNPTIKAYFTDIGSTTQLQASNLDDYTTRLWKPLDSDNQVPSTKKQDNLMKITTTNSPLYTDKSKGYPVYNYYPEVIVN
jgi:hypothetical protein